MYRYIVSRHLRELDANFDRGRSRSDPEGWGQRSASSRRCGRLRGGDEWRGSGRKSAGMEAGLDSSGYPDAATRWLCGGQKDQTKGAWYSYLVFFDLRHGRNTGRSEIGGRWVPVER